MPYGLGGMNVCFRGFLLSPKIIIHKINYSNNYSETNVMHFLVNLFGVMSHFNPVAAN
jgi:hypothetical protein